MHVSICDAQRNESLNGYRVENGHTSLTACHFVGRVLRFALDSIWQFFDIDKNGNPNESALWDSGGAGVQLHVPAWALGAAYSMLQLPRPFGAFPACPLPGVNLGSHT